MTILLVSVFAHGTAGAIRFVGSKLDAAAGQRLMTAQHRLVLHSLADLHNRIPATHEVAFEASKPHGTAVRYRAKQAALDLGDVATELIAISYANQNPQVAALLRQVASGKSDAARTAAEQLASIPHEAYIRLPSTDGRWMQIVSNRGQIFGRGQSDLISVEVAPGAFGRQPRYSAELEMPRGGAASFVVRRTDFVPAGAKRRRVESTRLENLAELAGSGPFELTADVNSPSHSTHTLPLLRALRAELAQEMAVLGLDWILPASP